LNASIGITVDAAVALCNELALAGCRIVRLRRLQAAHPLPRLVHLVEPDEHAAFAPQHAVHAALAQALLQLCRVAFDHQRAIALHLHDGHGLKRSSIRQRSMTYARCTGAHCSC